ncbi:MAG: hypothetical protein HYZ92_03545 [Candidatus Omnitrophica bacterium]|nr:hypothetical protein [Candidatus Omnitrophota bacterium]
MMTRSYPVAATCALLALFVIVEPAHAGPAVGPEAWQPIGNGLPGHAIRSAVAAQDAPLLIAGTTRTVYASRDNGRAWTSVLQLSADTDLHALAIDPTDPQHLLAATSSGLYQSRDGGTSWQRSFRGNGAQSICRIVLVDPAMPERIWLGTDAGLFVSLDRGGRWQPDPAGLEQPVVAMAVHVGTPLQIYAATDQGLLVRTAQETTWHRLFPVIRPESSPADSAEERIEESEESDARLHLSAVAVDPQNSRTIFLGTANGLWISRDAGANWQAAETPALGTGAIRRLALVAHSPTVAYIATADGVGRYDPSRREWQLLSAGLPTVHVDWLSATPTAVYAATDLGLYKLELPDAGTTSADWPSAEELLNNFVTEPTIGQVQQVAIRHAEVQPEKILLWRRQAALKALLPSVHLNYDHDRDTYVTGIGSTTNPTFDRILTANDPSHSLGFSLGWDFGDLIWNDDQTSIDARSRLMVQLRDDILDEVTRHYYERRRMQLALMSDPPAAPKERLEKELRIQELTALIDGMTGGWFSEHLKSGN